MPNSQQIDDLLNRINSALGAGTTLTVDGQIVGTPATFALVELALGSTALIVENAQVASGNDTVSVSGTSDVLGVANLSVELEFTPTTAGLALTIRATAVGNQIQIPGIAAKLFGGGFSVPSQLASVEFQSFSITADPQQGSVPFNVTLTEDLDLGGHLLVLSDVGLTLVSSLGSTAILASLVGALTIGGVAFNVRGSFDSAAPENARFEFEPAAGALSVTALVKHFLTAIPSLPDLTISAMEFDADLNTGFFNFRAQVDGTWTIPLGVNPPQVTSPNISLARTAAGVSGSVQGTLRIAGVDIDVTADLQGDLTLTGQLPSIDLAELSNDLVGSTVSLPSGFPSITLPPTPVQIRLSSSTAVFAAGFQIADFGTGFIVVLKSNGDWEIVTGFALPDDWQFADLSTVLSPLDQVLTTLAPPALVLSSFADPNFEFPPAAPDRLPSAVAEGVSLVSTVSLDGPILGIIGGLLGLNELPLAATFGNTFGDTVVRATRAQLIAVLPGVLSFENVIVAVSVAGDVQFSCDARLGIPGVPLLTASTGVDDGQPTVGLATAEVWNNPFGISNLIVNQLAIEFTPAISRLEFLGKVEIAGNPIKMFVQLTGNVPTAVSGEFVGDLSIISILDDLVGLEFPASLPVITFSDLAIHAVSPPGATIAGEQFAPGLALRGTVKFFGLGASFRVEVDPASGVFAQGAMAQIITVGNNVLVISNAAGNGPASATIDTRVAPPFMRISGSFALLDLLNDSIDAEFKDSSFHFQLTGKRGPATYSLACEFHSPTKFTATGTFELTLNESIRLAAGGVDLGTISLSAGVDGKLDLAVSGNSFSADFKAGFEFAGQDFSIAFSLDVSPDMFKEGAEQIVQAAIDRVKDAFSNLADNVGEWLNAVRDGIVTGVSNVALVLRDRFGQTPQEIGNAIKNTLNQGSKVAAAQLKSIGQDLEAVGNVLKDLGDPRDEVISALESAGFPPDEVADKIGGIFPPVIIPYVGPI